MLPCQNLNDANCVHSTGWQVAALKGLQSGSTATSCRCRLASSVTACPLIQSQATFVTFGCTRHSFSFAAFSAMLHCKVAEAVGYSYLT